MADTRSTHFSASSTSSTSTNSNFLPQSLNELVTKILQKEVVFPNIDCDLYNSKEYYHPPLPHEEFLYKFLMIYGMEIDLDNKEDFYEDFEEFDDLRTDPSCLKDIVCYHLALILDFATRYSVINDYLPIEIVTLKQEIEAQLSSVQQRLVHAAGEKFFAKEINTKKRSSDAEQKGPEQKRRKMTEAQLEQCLDDIDNKHIELIKLLQQPKNKEERLLQGKTRMTSGNFFTHSSTTSTTYYSDETINSVIPTDILQMESEMRSPQNSSPHQLPSFNQTVSSSSHKPATEIKTSREQFFSSSTHTREIKSDYTALMNNILKLLDDKNMLLDPTFFHRQIQDKETRTFKNNVYDHLMNAIQLLSKLNRLLDHLLNESSVFSGCDYTSKSFDEHFIQEFDIQFAKQTHITLFHLIQYFKYHYQPRLALLSPETESFSFLINDNQIRYAILSNIILKSMLILAKQTATAVDTPKLLCQGLCLYFAFSHFYPMKSSANENPITKNQGFYDALTSPFALVFERSIFFLVELFRTSKHLPTNENKMKIDFNPNLFSAFNAAFSREFDSFQLLRLALLQTGEMKYDYYSNIFSCDLKFTLGNDLQFLTAEVFGSRIPRIPNDILASIKIFNDLCSPFITPEYHLSLFLTPYSKQDIDLLKKKWSTTTTKELFAHAQSVSPIMEQLFCKFISMKPTLGENYVVAKAVQYFADLLTAHRKTMNDPTRTHSTSDKQFHFLFLHASCLSLFFICENSKGRSAGEYFNPQFKKIAMTAFESIIQAISNFLNAPYFSGGEQEKEIKQCIMDITWKEVEKILENQSKKCLSFFDKDLLPFVNPTVDAQVVTRKFF